MTNFDTENVSEISFQVLDSEVQNYETPFVYCNLTSPITLSYINRNVKANYTPRNLQTSIIYDGRLLKTANVDLTKLDCELSLKIILTTIENCEYQCRLRIPISLKNENSSILEGSILQTIPQNGSGKFYQF